MSHGSKEAPAGLSALDYFRKPCSGREVKVWPLEGAKANVFLFPHALLNRLGKHLARALGCAGSSRGRPRHGKTSRASWLAAACGYVLGLHIRQCASHVSCSKPGA